MICFSHVLYTLLSSTRKISCLCDRGNSKLKTCKCMINNAYAHVIGQMILFPNGYHFSSLRGTLQSWMLIAPTNTVLLFTISIKTWPWSSKTSSYTTCKWEKKECINQTWLNASFFLILILIFKMTLTSYTLKVIGLCENILFPMLTLKRIGS